ncbi:MAG: AraC family transcriptional regulator [Brevundimonas sp.]|nr:AraC family transcriptional regulator [Brevundimonas sp.]
MPFEPFNTRWETALLGEVTFVYTEITGMSWERRIDDIRESDFDPVIISMMIEGRAQGDMDGRTFLETPGTFHFHDLARPSLHVSTASRTYNLVVSRPVATAWFGSLHDLHGLVIPQDEAAMLFSHAAHVRRSLPRFSLAEADRLGRVFLELAALALAGARPPAQPPVAAEHALRRRAAEKIEQRLGGGDTSVAGLCRTLGVSRRRLFAAFRPDGGVETYVTGQRLNRARAALSDLERSEPVGAIAHRFGFCDASHLSRAFRGRYGMTPSDYRRLAAADRDSPDTEPPAKA